MVATLVENAIDTPDVANDARLDDFRLKAIKRSAMVVFRYLELDAVACRTSIIRSAIGRVEAMGISTIILTPASARKQQTA